MDGVLLTLQCTKNTVIPNGDGLLLDADGNLYANLIYAGTTLYQYIACLDTPAITDNIPSLEPKWCREFVDLPDTNADSSNGRSCFSNIFLQDNNIVACGTKNIRPSNEVDSSVGIVSLNKRDGSVTYNCAYTDNPASNYLGTTYTACVQNSSLIIMIKKWVVSAKTNYLGYLAIDLRTGNLAASNSCALFNKLAYTFNGLGCFSTDIYCYYLSNAGELVRFSTSASTAASVYKLPNFTPVANAQHTNNIAFDEQRQYLYVLTTDSSLLLQFDSSFAYKQSVKFPVPVNSIRCYGNMLYVFAKNLLFLLNASSLATLRVIKTNFNITKFSVMNSHLLFTFNTNSGKSIHLVSIPVDNLQDIFDVTVPPLRLIKKNPALYPLQRSVSVNVPTTTNYNVTSASVLTHTPYTVNSVTPWLDSSLINF